MRNGVNSRRNRFGNFLKKKLAARSRRYEILAAATAWIAPLKRSSVLAVVQALTAPKRRSTMMAAATAMVVVSAGSFTPAQGDTTAYYTGPSGGYWNTSGYWTDESTDTTLTFPYYPTNGSGTYGTFIINTESYTGSSTGATVYIGGLNITVGEITGSNNTGIAAIVNGGASDAYLTINPNSLSSPTGSTIYSAIENTGGAELYLQLGTNQGTNTSIVNELYGKITGNVEVIVDGIEGTSDFVNQSNTYSGGTIIENGATAIAENSNSFGLGTITFQPGGGGTIKFGQNVGTIANSIVLNANATINNNGYDGIFTGTIGPGNGTLTITNSGTGGYVALAGINSYSGGTIIGSGATVLVDNSGVFGTGAITFTTGGGTIELGNVDSTATVGNLMKLNAGAAGTTLDSNGGYITFSGVISGTGALTITNSGFWGSSGSSVELDGINTYKGGTTIDSGATLVIGTSGSIIDALTMNGTSTFVLENSLVLTDLNATSSGAYIGIGGAGGYTLTLRPTTNDTFSGIIKEIATDGGATINFNGNVGTTFTLTGTNSSISDVKTININSGTVIVGSGGYLNANDGSLGEETMIGSNGTLTVNTGGSVGGYISDNGIFNVNTDDTISGLSDTGSHGQVIIGSGNTLTLDMVNNTTFNGRISGSGGLTVAGGGFELTLTGLNTYTGTTVIGNGSSFDEIDVAAGGSISGGGGITINGFGTLSVEGTITGSVTDNGTFDVNNSFGITDLTGAGAINLGSSAPTLTIAPTGTNNDLYTGTISGTGALIINGASGSTLTLEGLDSAAGTTEIKSGTLNVNSGGSISSLSAITIDGNGILTVSGTGSVSGSVTDNGTFNVLANDTIGDLNGTNAAALINIGSGDTLTVTPTVADNFSGAISGLGGLTVNGASGTSLTLSGALTYSGTTTLENSPTLTITSSDTLGGVQFGSSAGALQVQNNLSITDLNGTNTSASILISSYKTLTVSPTGADDFEGSIGGGGGLTLNGGGSLTLSGVLSYSGTTTIGSSATFIETGGGTIGSVLDNGGTFSVLNSLTIDDLNGSGHIILGSLGTTSYILTINAGATPDTFSGSISGAGGLTLATGTLNLTGSLTYTGPTTVDLYALLNITGSSTVYNLSGAGNLTIATGAILTDKQDGTTTFSGNISGGGGFDIYGNPTGDLITTGTLTYTGETTIYTGATLTLSGQNDIIGGVDVMTGGTFAITPDTTIGDLTGGGTVFIGPGETLTSVPTTNDTFTGTIIGDGSFILGNGSGGVGTSLTLTGVNTYSGGTTISATNTLTVTGSIEDAVTDNGTFNVQNNFSITDLSGTGALNISENLKGTGYTLTVTPAGADKLDGPVSDDGSLVIDGTNSLELRGNVTGIGSIVVGTGTDTPTLTLDGTDTYSGGTTINSGATLTVSSTGSMVGPVIDDGTWNIENNLPGITDLNGSGSIIITFGKTLTVAPIGIDDFSGVISTTGGAGGSLVVDGSGSLQLDGVNTYSGGTTIGSTASLIVSITGSIKGALTNNGTFTLQNSLSLTDLSGTNTAATINIGTDGATLTIAPTTNDTYAGNISGAGFTGTALTINGNHATTFTLSGNITDVTNLNVNTGTVNVASGGYDGAGTTNIGTSGTLIVSSGASMAGAVTDNGTWTLNNSVSITDLTGAATKATISIGTGATLTVTPTAADVYSGSVTDTGSLAVEGTNSLEVVGKISGAGSVVVGTGTDTPTLTLDGPDTYSGGTTINVGGTLITNGSITGPVIENGIWDVNNTTSITDLTGTSASALISLGSGAQLTVNSTGTDSYAGSINGVGDFTLATGTLDLTTQNAINLTGTGATTIDANATLNVMGTIAGTVIDNGTLGVLTNQNIGNLSGSGAISITNLETLTITETGTSTFTGTVSGPGDLTLIAAGETAALTFTGPLTYTGQTTIGSSTGTGATMILAGTNPSSIGALDVYTGNTFELLPNVSVTDLSGGGTISIGSTDTLTSTPTTTDTFTGTIIGAGAFVLGNGAGGTNASLLLTGINTYSGGTTITATNKLIISTTGSIGTGALTVNGTFVMNNSQSVTDLNGAAGSFIIIADGDTLTVNPNIGQNDTFSGVISQTPNSVTGGALILGGTTGSSLTLTGINVYTGGTTINVGATLDVTGSIAGPVENNGTFNVENSFNITDLTGTSVSALINIGSGDTLKVTPTKPDTYYGGVNDTGSLAVNGTSALDIKGPVSGTGTVVVGTGSDTPTLTLDGPSTYSGPTTINVGGTLVSNGTGTTGAVVENGAWDINNTMNITDLTGTNTTAEITLGSSGALTVSSTGVDSYAGGINGVGDFTLATGTLDLTTQNAIDLTGTGATTIDANATLNVMGTIAGTVIDNGTLGILTNQNIGNLSGSGAISITNLETLTITETGTSTFTGTISGLGGLTLNPGSSPGTLTFTNALSYTGETTIGSGATMILTGTSASSIGGLDVMTGGTFEILPNVSITDLTGGGTVSIGVGDTLTSTPSSPLSPDTFTGTIIGSGQFVLLGVAGTSLTLTGINTYSGGTTIGTTATLIVSGSITGAVTDDGGTFTVQNTFAITDLNGSGVINLGTTGNTLTVEPSLNTSDTFSGSITGGTGGGLTVDGSSGGTENSLVLTGDLAAYTGTTTIQNNGALGIEYSDNLGSTAAITFGTGNTTDGFLAFLGTGSQTLGALTLGGTDTIDAGGAGNTVTLNSTVTSSAGYKITLQNGTFILGTSASFSGWTGGTVQIGNVMGSGSSASSLPATLQFGAAPNIGSNPATIVFDDGTADYTGSGNTDLPDNINYVVDAAGGTVEITGTAAGTLTIAGTITDTTGGTLTFSGNTPNSSVPSFIITSDNSATLTSGTVAIGDAPTNVEISNEDAFGNAVVTVSDDSTLETSNFVAGTSAATFFDDITAAGYSQDSTSSLSLSALGRPTTGYDEFQLGGGAASLNGTLNLSFVAKPHDYDTYDIINTTGTVTNNGIFNNAVTVTNPYLHETFTIDGGRTAANSSGWSDIVDVNANTKTPDDFYLRFWETSTPGTGQQVIVQTLLSPFATNQSALDIAKYLDDYAAPGAISKPLQTALSNLSGQSAAAIANALNSMSVTDYAAIQQTAFQNSTFLNQQVFAQMANGFGGGGVNTSGLSIMNTDGAAPDPFSMALNSQLQTTEQSVQQTMAYMDNYNSWSVGEPVPSNNQGSSSTTESNVGATGFPSLVVNSVSMFVAGDVVISNTPDGNPSGTANYLTGGVLLGGGVQLDENWSVGGFFNWGYTGASLDNVGSHQQGNSYTPGLFVGYQNDGWYANGLLSYTYNTYRIDRNVQFGSASYTATGQPTSSEYNVSLLGGYNAQLTDNFSMGPSAGVTYTHVDVSSFSESGSPFDMNVASQSTDSCRTLLGFLGQWTIPGKNFPMPLDINFNAYWQHEFLNNSGQIAASMTGVNNTSTFVFQTSAPVRDSFLGGVGIGGHINKNVALFANYELLAGGQNLFGQSVIAGVAIGFK